MRGKVGTDIAREPNFLMYGENTKYHVNPYIQGTTVPCDIQGTTVPCDMARTNDSKIGHVELLKAYNSLNLAYNISLSYCTVHIVRWNIMWNVYFFLMASRTLTVSDFQAESSTKLGLEVAVSYACMYKGCYQYNMLILDEQS